MIAYVLIVEVEIVYLFGLRRSEFGGCRLNLFNRCFHNCHLDRIVLEFPCFFWIVSCIQFGDENEVCLITVLGIACFFFICSRSRKSFKREFDLHLLILWVKFCCFFHILVGTIDDLIISFF